MPRKKKIVSVPLDAIWEIPDEAWERLEPILLQRYPPKSTGRKRIDWRKAINGIIFRLRTGCQWNHLPETFGDDSSVHRWFQKWVADGVLEKLWALLLSECDELGGVDWEWQAADGFLGKSRFQGGKRGEIRRTEASKERRKASLSSPAAALLG
jgi:putative transposase